MKEGQEKSIHLTSIFIPYSSSLQAYGYRKMNVAQCILFKNVQV